MCVKKRSVLYLILEERHDNCQGRRRRWWGAAGADFAMPLGHLPLKFESTESQREERNHYRERQTRNSQCPVTKMMLIEMFSSEIAHEL